jgi:hypothetical protein
VRGQGWAGGAFAPALNFLLTFSFKRKSKESYLKKEKKIGIWAFERLYYMDFKEVTRRC